MATTVEILIKGISICYEKDGHWNVLFPINNCHKVVFSYRKDDEQDQAIGELRNSTEPIKITTTNSTSVMGTTSDFDDFAFDLTSPATHSQIQKRGDIKGKAVLLTIPNAVFSVEDYLQNLTPVVPALEDNLGNLTDINTLIGHSLKATISLGAGGSVKVESDAMPDDLVLDDGGFYTLTFDNDCEIIVSGQNDMDMFYNIIEEPGVQDRRFRIVAKPDPSNLSGSALRTDPPELRSGKPCLAVKASSPGDLPSDTF